MTIILQSNTRNCSASELPGATQAVRFIYNNPEANEVFLAGSFNDWNPGATPMSRVGRDHWIKDLGLRFGRYEYQYVVDGRWMPDRTATELVENPLGGINSVVYVQRPRFDPASMKEPVPSINPKCQEVETNLERR